MNDAVLPWPKPLSVYDSGGPRTEDEMPLEFEVAGVRFRIASTSVLAPTTFRMRYHVQCRTCTKTLHDATTGPKSYIRMHLKEAHGFTGNLRYEDDDAS